MHACTQPHWVFIHTSLAPPPTLLPARQPKIVSHSKDDGGYVPVASTLHGLLVVQLFTSMSELDSVPLDKMSCLASVVRSCAESMTLRVDVKEKASQVLGGAGRNGSQSARRKRAFLDFATIEATTFRCPVPESKHWARRFSASVVLRRDPSKWSGQSEAMVTRFGGPASLH